MPWLDRCTTAAFGTLGRVTGELLNPSSCPGCFVCGSENPSGLGLHVHRDGTDAVAIWIPSATYQGYPDRLHILFNHGFASAKVTFGGAASLVQLDELRGIPVESLLDRYLFKASTKEGT